MLHSTSKCSSCFTTFTASTAARAEAMHADHHAGAAARAARRAVDQQRNDALLAERYGLEPSYYGDGTGDGQPDCCGHVPCQDDCPERGQGDCQCTDDNLCRDCAATTVPFHVMGMDTWGARYEWNVFYGLDRAYVEAIVREILGVDLTYLRIVQH